MEGGLQRLAARLTQARRDRRLTQEEVARRLGVSRPTLVAIEKGQRSVRPKELVTLAALYGRSVHELAGDRPTLEEFAPQFRATEQAAVSRKALDEAVAEFRRACEDYAALEEMLKAPLPRRAYPEVYSTEGLPPAMAAEEVALQERSRLGLGQGPIPDLFGILESDVGLRVFALPVAELRIAGMYAYTDRLGGCILINGSHPATRQAWSAAHEYGHFLTARYRGEVTVLGTYERKPRSEQLADAFAACFLMPATGLRQRFRAVVQSRRDFTVADLYWLAEQYGVSVEAMARRLSAVGCIERSAWDRISDRGISRRTPLPGEGTQAGTRPAVRLPERFRRLAVQAHEEGVVSESELARLLRCSRVEAREAVRELTSSEDVGPEGRAYQLELDFGQAIPLAEAARS